MSSRPVMTVVCCVTPTPWRPYERPTEEQGAQVLIVKGKNEAEKLRLSASCMECHKGVTDPHPRTLVSCVDCHGGDGTATTKAEAHVRPVKWENADRIGRTTVELDRDPPAVQVPRRQMGHHLVVGRVGDQAEEAVLGAMLAEPVGHEHHLGVGEPLKGLIGPDGIEGGDVLEEGDGDDDGHCGAPWFDR